MNYSKLEDSKILYKVLFQAEMNSFKIHQNQDFEKYSANGCTLI